MGDRIDTDMVPGLEAGMQTMQVLTVITDRDLAERIPSRATRILVSVAVLIDEIA